MIFKTYSKSKTSKGLFSISTHPTISKNIHSDLKTKKRKESISLSLSLFLPPTPSLPNSLHWSIRTKKTKSIKFSRALIYWTFYLIELTTTTFLPAKRKKIRLHMMGFISHMSVKIIFSQRCLKKKWRVWDDPYCKRRSIPVWMCSMILHTHSRVLFLKKCGYKKKNSLSIFISLKKLFCADFWYVNFATTTNCKNGLIDF